jgi:phosphoglycerol transferase MdoB-like AlkP superfamily enzyme
MAAPLNPLRAPGTVLPPQLLLMAKLAVLVMPGPPFSPVAMVLFPLGAATLFLTRFVRSACLLLSAVELREVLISPRALEIHLYPIVLLLVAGLYQPSMGRSLLRWPALRRVYPWAAWSAVLLQTVLLWREHHPFGTFDCTILASYLLFAEWPEGKLRVIYDDQSPFCAWIKNRLERLDWAEAFEWEPQQ